MQSFGVFRRREDNIWDAINVECEEFPDVWTIVAGSLHIVDANNRAEALSTVSGITEIIKRAFADVQEQGNEYAYHKWFGGANNEF